MAAKTLGDELGWLDGKFVKSMGRVYYLCLIENGCDHGYDILQYMKSHFGLKLSAAAVYPVLQCLDEEGYISGEWLDGGYPRRKRYALTPKGRRFLAAARKRIHSLVRDLTRKSAGRGEEHGRA